MRRLRTGSKQSIRDLNRNIVLNLIKRHGPVSRVELAKLSSLAGPTVGEIAALLLAEQLVVEVGAPPSERRGPRPMLLTLNRSGAYALGAMLRPDGMNLVMVDLWGEVVLRGQRSFPPDATPDAVLSCVAEAIRDHTHTTHSATSSILGLGIAMTGVIDSAAGVCREAYILGQGWRNVPVAAIMEAALDIPVHVANDTVTLVVAEQHFGLGQNRQNFVLVTVGRGVGMGAVINGELLRGQEALGPEFGHITMVLDGPLCPCGKRGCLEAIASDVGILQAALDAGHVQPTASIEQLTARALAGDAALAGLFYTAGVALGQAIANLINVFAPELVVLTGEGLRAGALLLDPLRETLPRCTFGTRLEETEIAVKPWNPQWEPWARGAASLVLDDLLRPPIYDRGSTGTRVQARH